jgi:nitrogen fixation protein NifB
MFENHPCFNSEVRHTTARIHLPVAPKCNVQCNFCNRKYDCINESRPGVTSVVLKPAQALQYLDAAKEKMPNIAVVGIAGPGDPFATPDETLQTLHLVRNKYPNTLLCLASNGLAIGGYVNEIAALNISHVTITLNAVDPEIGAKIYAWVRNGVVSFRGITGADLLFQQQSEAIRLLKQKKITVKVNTVVIPGVNEEHVEEVSRFCQKNGVDVQNCIPLLPVQETPFAGLPVLPPETVTKIRQSAEKYVPQMSHCSRCRADAVGLLGADNEVEMDDLLRQATVIKTTPERPCVAVATMEGLFVNRHLGESASLFVFRKDGEKIVLDEERQTPMQGLGDKRWELLADAFKDCTAILVSGCGKNPQQILERKGLQVIKMEGLLSDALPFIFNGRELPKILLRDNGCGRGRSCSGTGGGCG